MSEARSAGRRIYEATWGRLFAWSYDRMLASTEAAGLAEKRRELLSKASGRCLEIGAGTGLNLGYWPGSVDELVLTEPDGFMAAQLREKAQADPRSTEVVEAPGEKLPFPDHSFDTVALTLVLCTAPDPAAVLREVDRLLKPGGSFLFLEHVRSDDPRVARWQDRLHRPWRAIGYGCNCNRPTLATIESSPLTLGDVERGELPKAPAFVRPMITGVARSG